MFKIFVPLHTIFPVTVKPFAICIVIPVFSVSYIVLIGLHLIPLFTGAHQWLMGGLPDGDPQLRTQLYDGKRILRTIQRKGCRPHRRPEIVSFQTQQKVKYLFIEKLIKIPKSIFYKIAQGGPLVIHKETTEFY